MDWDYKEIAAELRSRIHEDIDPVWKAKSKLELSFITDCLQNHFIFNNLSKSQLEGVAKTMLYCEVPPNKTIFDEGWEADCFFIIENGAFQVLLNGRVGRTLVAPDGFGQTALLGPSTRSTTVRSKVKSYLWLIDRISFRQAVQQAITQQYQHNRQYLQKLRFFSYLPNQMKDLISASLVELRFRKGQLIVQEGDPGSSFYIIRQGSVLALSGSKQVGRLGPGDTFGQNALYYNVVRKVTMKADEPVLCLGLGRQTLINILHNDYHKIVFQNLVRAAFDKSELLQELPEEKVSAAMKQFSIISHQAGQRLVAKGEQSCPLFIIVEGFVKKNRSGATAYRPGDIVAQKVVMGIETADDDYVMQTDGVVVLIQGVDLTSQAGYLSQLQDNIFGLGEVYQVLGSKTLTLGELVLVRGKTNSVVKRIAKAEVKDQSDLVAVKNQATCLRSLSVDSPFVAKFRGAWQTSSTIFIAQSYYSGLSLYDIIRAIGLLSTKDCQFYIANMLLAMRALKEARVLHRDIKPENWVADEEGYLNLVGFSCAKRLGAFSKTNTVVGSPHYMAPEVVTGKGYGWSADIWSLGILFYQMMCGGVPFGEELGSPSQVFQAIMKQDLSFPRHLKDKRAKRLIQTFLNRTPQFRNCGSYPLLLKEDWVLEGKPDDILARTAQPPVFDTRQAAKNSFTTHMPMNFLGLEGATLFE